LYRSVIAGTRYDDQDIGNLSGNTRLLNNLTKGSANPTQYAETDKETADLIINDVNLAIDRLNIIKTIHSLNQGNKLNL